MRFTRIYPLMLTALPLVAGHARAEGIPTETTPYSNQCRAFVQANYANCFRVRFLQCDDLPEHNRIREVTLDGGRLSQYARIEHYVENNAFHSMFSGGSGYRETDASRKARPRLDMDALPVTIKQVFASEISGENLYISSALKAGEGTITVSGYALSPVIDTFEERMEGGEPYGMTQANLYSPDLKVLFQTFAPEAPGHLREILAPGNAGFNEANDLPGCE